MGVKFLWVKVKKLVKEIGSNGNVFFNIEFIFGVFRFLFIISIFCFLVVFFEIKVWVKVRVWVVIFIFFLNEWKVMIGGIFDGNILGYGIFIFWCLN